MSLFLSFLILGAQFRALPLSILYLFLSLHFWISSSSGPESRKTFVIVRVIELTNLLLSVSLKEQSINGKKHEIPKFSLEFIRFFSAGKPLEMRKKNRIRVVYFLTLGGILLWLGIIFLAPYLKSQGSGLNIFAYLIFTPICHQIPDRSFLLFGHPLAVCARCLGIYFGFLGGMGLYVFRRGFSGTALPEVRTFVLITSPLVFDAIGNFLHLWSTPNWIRFSTGFLWGLILPFYFITGISDFFIKRDREKAKRT